MTLQEIKKVATDAFYKHHWQCSACQQAGINGAIKRCDVGVRLKADYDKLYGRGR